METKQAALLSIYLLEQAKNSIAYCGRESQIVVIPMPGWIIRLNQEYVDKAVTAFANFEKETNRLLLKAPEFQLNEQEVLKSWTKFYEGWPELGKKLDEILLRVEQFKQSSARTHPAFMGGITEPILPPTKSEIKKS